MATTKTLKPTNVTISIPAFTDQPDQRVNSNCIDKEADAINSLSEHNTTYELTTSGTQSALDSQFNTLVASMADKSSRNVKIQASASFGAFISGIYQGTVYKWSSSRVYAELISANNNITGHYLGSSWSWNDQITPSDVTLTAGTKTSIATQNSFKVGSVLYVNLMLTVNTALVTNDPLFTLPTGMKFAKRVDYNLHNGGGCVGMANGTDFFANLGAGNIPTGTYNISFCTNVS